MKNAASGDDRAVIYCRVSTIDQVQNHSLPTQEKACRGYCIQQGLEVVRVFVEEGESAKTADRTRLNELLTFVENRQNRISSVVVYAIDRFTRNAADHLALSARLSAKGIALHSVTQNFERGTSEGRLMETVIAALAEFENNKRAERTKAGMEGVVEQGGYPFHPPIGYRPAQKTVGNRTLPILKHDPERAPLIRRAFELVADGMTKAEALRRVTALGLRTLKGNPLSPQTFNEIMKKSIYCGRIETWENEGRGDFEPIISEELFDRVQVVLGLNVGGAAGPHLRHHPEFPLRRFLRCSHCSTPLTGSAPSGRNQRYAYYHCRTRGCAARNYPAREVEEGFRQFVERLQPNHEVVAAVCEAAVAAWQKSLADAERDNAKLRRRVSELTNRLTQLRETFIYRQEISKQDFDEEKERLTYEIVVAEGQIRESESGHDDVEAVVKFAEHVLNNAATVWWEASPELKLKIQDVLFPNGVEFDGEAFGTSRTNLLFSELALIPEPVEGMVAHTGFEPVLPP